MASPTSPWCFSTVALKIGKTRRDLFEWIAVSAKLSFKKNVSYFLSAIFWNSTWDQNFVSLSSCCVLSCRKNCTGAATPQRHIRPAQSSTELFWSLEKKTSWWSNPTHLKNMLVNLGWFPQLWKFPKNMCVASCLEKLDASNPPPAPTWPFSVSTEPKVFFVADEKKCHRNFEENTHHENAWLNQIKLQQIDCLYWCTYKFNKDVICFIIYYMVRVNVEHAAFSCFFLCKKRNTEFLELLAAKHSTLSLVVFFSGGKTPTVLIHATCLAVSYIHWIQFL